MNTKAYLACIIILFTNQLFGQSIPTKETSLCWFNLAVEENMYLTMGLDAETILAIMFQKDNEEANELMENSLAVVYEKVNKETGITLLPVNSLEGKVKYSRMGYPLASLKRASKKGSSPQYVKVDIEVSGARNTRNTLSREVASSDVNQELQREKLRPQIRVFLKFADKDGNTIDRIQGRYRHDEKVEITSRRLSTMGWSFAYDQEADIIPYYYFLEKAVEDLVSKLNES